MNAQNHQRQFSRVVNARVTRLWQTPKNRKVTMAAAAVTVLVGYFVVSSYVQYAWQPLDGTLFHHELHGPTITLTGPTTSRYKLNTVADGSTFT
jgi:type II secretory pathway component PulM